MNTHINPALQLYLLVLLAASLTVVLANPEGTYNTTLLVAGLVLAFTVMGMLHRAGRAGCRLLSVGAGGSLTIRHQNRTVRASVWGIQAPAAGQPQFAEAAEALARCLQCRELAVKPVRPPKKRAAKGRARIARDMALVLFADGQDVGLMMLASGYAHLAAGADVPAGYRSAYNDAVDAGLGIHAVQAQAASTATATATATATGAN